MIEDLWYKNAVIYSLDVDAFMDGNGDGVGDFTGLIRRLDYLQTLGADVIWLAPFQPTPNRDNGYDISDYYGVDPRHGSSGLFVEFVHQAKKRGLKIIIDLVVNHTSDQHPWFQDARKSKDSKFRDWYVWSKTRPPGWNKGMVFPGVQKATWTRDPVAGEYYFHRFYDHQPDLNMDNPEVRTEILKIIGFWLQLGVDGFRVDAVPFIIETPTISRGGKPKLKFEYLEEMREFLNWRTGDAILLGEANVLPRETQKYFAEGHGIQMMFNFWVNQRLFYALASADVRPLQKALEDTAELPPTAQWAHFLRNHDELDLGRLTERQRQRVFESFGPDPSMQLYDRGIRRRLAPMLGSRQFLELAYSVLFALPGSPVIRYGDEIGMGDDLSLPERDAVRTPMQWSAKEGGGFSTAKKLEYPMVTEGPYGCRHVNVEDSRRDTGSLLRWTSRMIRLRKECPEIGWGKFEVIDTGTKEVLVLLSTWRGNSVLTVHNFDDQPHSVTFSVPMEGGDRLLNLLTDDDSHAVSGTHHEMALQAYGYRWFRVGAIDYALQRESEEPLRASAAPKRKRRRSR